MAYGVRVYVDVSWLPEGSGSATLGILASNNPGFGSTQGPGIVANAQSMRFQQQELVPGTLDAPTAANIGTAISTAATDIQAQITTAVIATIQGWATGSP